MPWREAVARKYQSENPWLNQIVTSPSRDLFFRQHPPPLSARILDVGTGWGQIALPLAAKCDGGVVALEPTPERLAFVQAVARQVGLTSRMYFVEADFFEVGFEQEFDLVTAIGVLEWVPKFREGEPRLLQLEFLRRALSCLRRGGQLVLGIENRVGLKYLLGTPDDHIGVSDIATYDAALAAQRWHVRTGGHLRSFTFTCKELTDLLVDAGFAQVTLYGAYPDYKLPEIILPLGDEVNAYFRKGGFVPEHDGTSGRRLAIQPELQSHYRSFAEMGAAHLIAPSFFAVATTI